MGTPQKDVKTSIFEAVRNYCREYFADVRIACEEVGEAINALFTEDVDYSDISTEQAVEEAIKETIEENPGMADELDKTKAIISDQQKRLEKQFGDVNSTSNIDEKDEDGYNKIPDKIGNITAEVSEEKAIEKEKQRAEGGKQKTRVEED